MNEILRDILLSETNQKDADDLDYCNIDFAAPGGSSAPEMPKFMMRGTTTAEKAATPLLHKIEEDCESGGTEKSAHIEEVIKQDPKKVRTVNFD